MFNKNKEKYQIRTDVAFEELDFRKLGFHAKEEIIEEHSVDGLVIRKTYVSSKTAEEINKKSGMYYLIDTSNIKLNQNLESVEKALIDILKDLFTFLDIDESDKGLIVGLGNINITPDSLGPMVIDNILVTRHLFELGEDVEGLSNICAISPGVMGQTGMETSDIIKAIIKEKSIDYLIVIDSLASRSVKRVCSTIQVTSAGISPGSGIGSSRKELSKEVLKIPVIAIGVPTVVDAVTIVSDTLEKASKHFKKYPASPLKHFDELTDRDKRILFEEILGDANFMVTPKEIDAEIEDLSRIISTSLDKSLHHIINE